MDGYKIKINTKKENRLIADLREKISREVVGQDRAIRRFLRATASYFAELKDPRRPIGGYLLAGPTGVGKSWFVETFARHFLGGKNKYRSYLSRIDCSDYAEGHAVSRLRGTTPGYIGYGEPPQLCQELIDALHFDVKVGKDRGYLISRLKELAEFNFTTFKVPPNDQIVAEITGIESVYFQNKPYKSVILFDEFEQAHPDTWSILLQILEQGELQLGKSGKKTSFANSVIALTSNIGQEEIQSMLEHFSTESASQREELDRNIYLVVKEKIQKVLPPQLFNRLEIIIFRPLKVEDFTKILDILLLEEQERLNRQIKLVSRFSIEINYTSEAKKFLLKEGIDVLYGARPLKRAVEKYVRTPIANGISSEEIKPGDKILIDRDEDKLVFLRKPRKSGWGAIKHKIKLQDVIEQRVRNLAYLSEDSSKEENTH